jgi:hypothetical protein
VIQPGASGTVYTVKGLIRIGHLMDAEGFDSFAQARDYYLSRRDIVRWIVVHATQSKDGTTAAESLQRLWATDDGRDASTHGVCDNDTVAGCVHLTHTAWAARGANKAGLHMEHCGWSEWTRAQWLDREPMLRRSAKTTALWAKLYGIPRRWLTVVEVQQGVKGFTDHLTISKAFPKLSTGHWDPGPGFPRDVYMGYVTGNLEDDVALTLEDKTWLRTEIAKAVHTAEQDRWKRLLGAIGLEHKPDFPLSPMLADLQAKLAAVGVGLNITPEQLAKALLAEITKGTP